MIARLPVLSQILRPVYQAVLCAVFALMPVSPSLAQSSGEAATSRDVFMAFFKAGDTNPDFDKMAAAHPEYRMVPRARQPSFLREERSRLVSEWQKLKSSEELLLVRVPVFSEIAHVQTADGREVYTLTLTLEQGDHVYFPYEYMDYKIAVLPQKIDELLYHEIQKSQYDLILSSLEGKRRGMSHIWFRLKPVKSYTNQPYDIGGTEQWVLLANIAGLSLVTQKGENLWHYSAPWYVSPVKNDLLDIYEEKKAEKEHEMATENPILPTNEALPSQ